MSSPKADRIAWGWGKEAEKKAKKKKSMKNKSPKSRIPDI